MKLIIKYKWVAPETTRVIVAATNCVMQCRNVTEDIVILIHWTDLSIAIEQYCNCVAMLG